MVARGVAPIQAFGVGLRASRSRMIGLRRTIGLFLGNMILSDDWFLRNATGCFTPLASERSAPKIELSFR